MGELKVNFTNIDEAVSNLKTLNQRILKYSNKSYSMQESAGASAEAMLAVGKSFTKLAKKIEGYVNDTITDLNNASDSFEKIDNELAKKYD